MLTFWISLSLTTGRSRIIISVEMLPIDRCEVIRLEKLMVLVIDVTRC